MVSPPAPEGRRTKSGKDRTVNGRYRKAGTEPPLDELMDDELVHLVMRRDRLTPDMVWAHVESARAILRGRMAMPQPVRRCA